MVKKILVVDDEIDILKILDKRLSQANYVVLKADNGKDAVEIAKKEKPNLILLDIMMPGMDGAETSRVLRDDPGTKNIPIVFLTCLMKKEEERQGNVIGGSYFVAKPYKPDELMDIIRKTIA